MNDQLSLHDVPILNVIVNFSLRSCQIICASNLNKILIIEIEEILNIKETGENCLIKIFDGEGLIDDGKILKDGNRFVLKLKGIVDPKIERYKNIFWEIDIEAGKIKTEEKEMDESLQEKLLQQSKIDIIKLFDR